MPWDLDMAMLRRLEKRIYIPLPDEESRLAMIQRYIPAEMSEELNYGELAKALGGYSGSDIKLVCKEAAMKPLRRLLSQIEDLQVEGGKRGKQQQQWDEGKSEVRPGPVTSRDFREAMD